MSIEIPNKDNNYPYLENDAAIIVPIILYFIDSVVRLCS